MVAARGRGGGRAGVLARGRGFPGGGGSRAWRTYRADKFQLPFVPPFHGELGQSNFTHGANFAVIGATGLDLSFFLENNITSVPPFNNSLSVQLEWFQKLKPTLCSTPQECREYFKRSLFFMGEFGGNDYVFFLAAGKTVEEVVPYVPRVVQAISAGVEAVIKEGARYVVVPGQQPNGCTPIILTLYASSNSTDYEARTGCLKKHNTLTRYHNSKLLEALSQLRLKYPSVKIVYADHYKPVIDFQLTPARFAVFMMHANPGVISDAAGFSGKAGLRTCCGAGGGPYNYDLTAACGFPGVTACQDPDDYVNWDGIHLTEAAYRHIAAGWLHGPYAHPPILEAVRAPAHPAGGRERVDRTPWALGQKQPSAFSLLLNGISARFIK
ncbi:hypothetical protein GUJ93_ZPchr0008g11671 [Zizania palustris]|uniref:Esterase n=1 Tax=Zizania palustris TaxID=103762 RepID=A0A8J5VFH3_ZIZPA|nr:hypothetical protein GUJ93_ZPchr0008g11671 [Zizania palustris]